MHRVKDRDRAVGWPRRARVNFTAVYVPGREKKKRRAGAQQLRGVNAYHSQWGPTTWAGAGRRSKSGDEGLQRAFHLEEVADAHDLGAGDGDDEDALDQGPEGDAPAVLLGGWEEDAGRVGSKKNGKNVRWDCGSEHMAKG